MTNIERSNHGSEPGCQDRRIAHQLRNVKKRDARKRLNEIREEARKRAQEKQTRLEA